MARLVAPGGSVVGPYGDQTMITAACERHGDVEAKIDDNATSVDRELTANLSPPSLSDYRTIIHQAGQEQLHVQRTGKARQSHR
jgi:hypothetical protein